MGRGRPTAKPPSTAVIYLDEHARNLIVSWKRSGQNVSEMAQRALRLAYPLPTNRAAERQAIKAEMAMMANDWNERVEIYTTRMRKLKERLAKLDEEEEKK